MKEVQLNQGTQIEVMTWYQIEELVRKGDAIISADLFCEISEALKNPKPQRILPMIHIHGVYEDKINIILITGEKATFTK